jgi:hypothetical protein
MGSYIKKSVLTIIRAYMMYRPLTFFTVIGLIPFIAGLIIMVRFLIFFANGSGMGHIQSLILASTLMMLSFTTVMMGFQADLMAANRKIMEDVQYRLRRFEAGMDADAKERKER